jgi:hypothetical protein
MAAYVLASPRGIRRRGSPGSPAVLLDLRFRAWWRSAFTGGRSAAGIGTGAVWRSAADNALEIALTFALCRFECGAGGVDAAGVEHGSFAGRVGCRQVHAVFAHAGDELRERRFGCGGAEAGSASEVAATAFLQRFLELRGTHSGGRLEPTAAAAAQQPSASPAARRTFAGWRGQRDPLFCQAGSQCREPARSSALWAFRRLRAGRRSAGAGARGARRAACGASARRQRGGGAEHCQRYGWPDSAAVCGFREATWVHELCHFLVLMVFGLV